MTAAFAPIAGLSQVADRYDLILCDVFGTLHDARRVFPEALDALRRFRRREGCVVLVSNAAEPAARLGEALAARGIADVHDALVTAADVARAVLREREPDCVLHIGPERDRSVLEGFAAPSAGSEADLIVCTGYPDEDATLDAVLAAACRRGALMLCTNPDTDLALEHTTLRFAGLVANRYRALGGSVCDTGKPGAAIYAWAIETALAATGRRFPAERVIGIGDTPALDAAGALARGHAAAVIAPDVTELPRVPGSGSRYRLPALSW